MYSIYSVKSSSDWQLPQKSCLINYSVLKETVAAAPFRSFSIKYVCHGQESYQVNGNRFLIKAGEYLLANHHAYGTVEIEQEVRGICIDVSPDLLSEAAASFLRADTPMADQGLDNFFNSPSFLESKYHCAQTQVGAYLKQLDMTLQQDLLKGFKLNREFYLSLAEKIVADHIPVFKKLQQLSDVKSDTRKAIVRKIILAMQYIESEAFNSSLTIADIAAHCGMSEFHFYRMFKKINHLSPYQYVMQCKLNHARTLMQQQNTTVTETAYLCGFSDIFTFSRAYKKYFGCSPSMHN
jgi:AraC-like DNA-binding protein